MKTLLPHAVALLTRLPVRVAWPDDLRWGRVAAWFPAAGALLGLPLFALALFWSASPFPYRAPFLGPALVLALWAALTGALHLDGWSDCCDAFFTPATRERRLEIMADPRLGSFGATGLGLLLLAKFAALHGLLARAPADVPATLEGLQRLARPLLPLIVIPALARWTVVLVLADCRLPLARPGGMGARCRDGLDARALLLATACALLPAAWLGLAGAVFAATAVLVAIGIARLARARIGGLTGDVLGAIVEGVETAALACAALWA